MLDDSDSRIEDPYIADDDGEGLASWGIPPPSEDRDTPKKPTHLHVARIYGHTGGPPSVVLQQPTPRGRPAWDDHVAAPPKLKKHETNAYDARTDKHCVAYTHGRNFRVLEKKRKVIEEVEKVTRAKKPSAALWRRRPQPHLFPPLVDAAVPSPPHPPTTVQVAQPPLLPRITPRVMIDEHQRQLSDALTKERAARCALSDKKLKLEKQLADAEKQRMTLAGEMAKWKDKMKTAETQIKKAQVLEQEKFQLAAQLRRKDEMYKDLKEYHENVAAAAPPPRQAPGQDEYRSKALRQRLNQEAKCRLLSEGLLTQANEEGKKLKDEVARLQRAIQDQIKSSPRKPGPGPPAAVEVVAASFPNKEIELLRAKSQRWEHVHAKDLSTIGLLKQQVDDLMKVRNEPVVPTTVTVYKDVERIVEVHKEAPPPPKTQTRTAESQTPPMEAVVVKVVAPLPPPPPKKIAQVTSVGTATVVAVVVTKHTQSDPVPTQDAEIASLKKQISDLTAKVGTLEKYKETAELSQKDRVIEELTRKVGEYDKQCRVLSETNTALLERLKQQP